MDTKPKLSEATRLGWQQLPYGKVVDKFQQQHIFDTEDGLRVEWRIGAACAIGAACYAVAPSIYIDELSEALELFPELNTALTKTQIVAAIETIDPDMVEAAACEPSYNERSETKLGDIVMYWNDEVNMEPSDLIAAIEALGF